MTIPQLPTDNLYKFLTFFGLSLCALGAYNSIIVVRQELDRLLSVHQDSQKERFAIISAAIENNQTGGPREYQRFKEVQPLIDQSSDPEKALKEYKEVRLWVIEGQTQLFKDRLATLKQIDKEASHLADFAIKDARNKGERLFWLGTVISLSGVVGWYFGHQRYQDRLIRADAEKAQLALETERKAAGTSGKSPPGQRK